MTTDKAQLFANYWRMLEGGNHETPTAEYRFHPVRRWRFDWGFPDSKVAVEVDGNAWHVRGGGRHGKDSDLEKMNAAVSLGWRVFRFSPKMLTDDPASCVAMVARSLED